MSTVPNSAQTERNQPTFHGSKRPKIWLRREPDERIKCAIRQYILNRGTQAEAMALANLEALYAGKPVEVV